jgi:polysaccharide pyruvyl transferase WcaK-like protein
LHICLLDPSLRQGNLPSTNLGDQIIGRAVRREIAGIFPGVRIRRISTHLSPKVRDLRWLLLARQSIVGGSNLLCSDVDTYNQWKINPLLLRLTKKTVLLGAGWWQYQQDPAESSRRFYKHTLCGKRLHSVRDSYTLDKLSRCGRFNVVNTGCPTMWRLPANGGNRAGYGRASAVLTTITDYSPSPVEDRAMLQALADAYSRVYLWPQGAADEDYLKTLGVNISVLRHSLEDLERFTDENRDIDYVGTRLHCGIYCLEKNIRSLVVQIDNRAAEISKDTGLPTCMRGDTSCLDTWLIRPNDALIRLPELEISRWKSQFAS